MPESTRSKPNKHLYFSKGEDAVNFPVYSDKDNTTFLLLSFEGPDRYSFAGGLAVRVTNLTQTIASMGYVTHLLFIGDPYKEGRETTDDGTLTLHRWCQWISKYHPDGVYQGEHEKLQDFSKSVPPFVVDEIIRPEVAQGKSVVIMAEEWQTANAVCAIADLLKSEDLYEKVTILWNANNTYGFDTIDWCRLSQSATITTVSRYMKQIMRQFGLNALVIPNGIPKRLLDTPDGREVARLRNALGDRLVLSKVARWTPDKCWIEAVEAICELKRRGKKVTLIARGNMSDYETEVLEAARAGGLVVKDIHCEYDSHEARMKALEDIDDADFANVKFFLPEDSSKVLFMASDGVLANSGHEPFGLVGLETMAAGGVAFTGSTGEDYAIPFENAVVLETTNPHEIVDYVHYLSHHEEVEDRIRLAGRKTAQRYAWEKVVESLLTRIGQLRRWKIAEDAYLSNLLCLSY